MSPRPTVFDVANRRNAGLRMDDLVLVEQGHLALDLQDALDHEHHVRAAGIVLVEDERDRVLHRPGQDALAVLGHLLAVAQDDGVLADQVDAADVAVQVDAHARPVQPGRDLLDMGRLAGAVVALDHDTPIEREARQNGERRVGIEHVGRVDLGDVLGALAVGRDLEVRVDAEDLAGRQLGVRLASRQQAILAGILHHLSIVA